MILQSLYHHYDRLKNDPEIDIARQGYAPQKVHFALVLKEDGTVCAVDDLRDTTGKKPMPRMMLLPSIGRTSGVAPQFMWDNTKYVLGRVSPEEEVKQSEKQRERVLSAFEAFGSHHADLLADTKDPGLLALLRFFHSWNPEQAESLELWDSIIRETGPNFVFRLDGERKFLHQYPEVEKAWSVKMQSVQAGNTGFCLIEGCETKLAELHQDIKGVDGAQAKGAPFVSFNKKAFESYSKESGYNAPTGEAAAFAYATALNYLLRRDENNRQRIKIGDTTTVFWAEKDSPIEGWFGEMLDPDASSKSDNEQIFHLLDGCRQGMKVDDPNFDEDVRFYILCLSPNNARLAVRFWYAGTVGQIVENVAQHFIDLKIVLGKNDTPYPGIWRLLRETVRESKDISPILSGQLAQAVFTGQHYPLSLLNALLKRIRADRVINVTRAATIKAILNRNALLGRKDVITVSLDTQCTDPAYLMGRLFAILEKLQKDAQPGINSTIKDRFFSSASSTPAAVFPRLLQLSQHHLGKLENPGWKVAAEKRITEVMNHVEPSGFPPHLKMEQQGQFVIGYYHQMQNLYTSKKTEEE